MRGDCSTASPGVKMATSTKKRKEDESLVPYVIAGTALGGLIYALKSKPGTTLAPPLPQPAPAPQFETKEADAVLNLPPPRPPQPPAIEDASIEANENLDSAPKQTKPKETKEEKKDKATKQLIEDRSVLKYLQGELASIEEQLRPIHMVRLTEADVLRLQESRKNLVRLVTQQELTVRASEEKLQSLL